MRTWFFKFNFSLSEIPFKELKEIFTSPLDPGEGEEESSGSAGSTAPFKKDEEEEEEKKED